VTDKIAKRSVKQVKSRIRKPKGITPDKVLAFVANKSGKSQRVIGEELGKTQRTVSKYILEVEEYIKQSPEYQELGPQLAAMIPAAVAVYWRNLKEAPEQGSSDLQAARDIMKYAGLGKEKSGDVNVNVTITQEQRDEQLGTGLERFGVVAPVISDN
jgi:predicted transcriptional regulator